MGLHANMTVYGFLPPTLELELVDGGSLPADTKIYVCGMMAMASFTYIGVGSVPVLYDITTTSTKRSIKISQKTYRDVQGFADNGDGRTIINCTHHCLKATDVIKIDSGAYTGEWAVDEWVDYDTFIIDTPFAGDYVTTCYTDSINYNRSPGLNRTPGMVYYVNTVPPGYQTNRWTRAAYQTYNIENPTTITALPSGNFGDYCQVPEVAGLNTGMFKALLGYGTPHVYVDGPITPQELQTEMEAAGYPYHCGYSTQGYGGNPQFHIMASVDFAGAATFTLSNAVVIFGAEFSAAGIEEQVVFNNCSLNMPISTFTGYFNFTANECTIFNASTTNTLGGWVFGDNTRMYAIPRFGAYGDDEGIYHDQVRDIDVGYGISKNKDFRGLYGESELMQLSYTNHILHDCICLPIYYVGRSEVGYWPDVYMMENVKINYQGYNYHMRLYGYAYTDAYIRYDFLNVDTDEENNLKRTCHLDHTHWDLYFYRRLEFYVQGNGVFLDGAAVHIIDDGGNEYSGVTDENGYLYLDVLEQRTHYLASDPTSSSWQPGYDTLYGDFNITVSAAGFLEETLVIANGKGNEVNNIALVETPDPVYVDLTSEVIMEEQDKSQVVEQDIIEVQVEDSNLQTELENNPIEVQIEDEVINVTITERETE